MRRFFVDNSALSYRIRARAEDRNWRGPFAEVAELVDALGSGPSGGNTVGVRVPSSVPEDFLSEAALAAEDPFPATCDSIRCALRRVQVELENPPSTTMISPVTRRFDWMSDIMVSATSSAVTQRLSGVAFARLPMRSSYLSCSMRCIHSPSIQPGATALTRISGPKFQASVFVILTTAALLAA